MDLGEQAHRVTLMIRDCGPAFTSASGAVGLRRDQDRALQRGDPRINAIAERWTGGCRRELLDRTLLWNQHHPQRILRETEAPQSPPSSPLHARRRAAATTTPTG